MRTSVLTLFLLLLLAASACAQSHDLKVHLRTGTTVTISSDDIRRIHFTNVTLGVTDPAAAVARGSLQLLRAYPNPFRPSTTIEFQLSARAGVRARIYDLTGALVRELVDGDLTAGRHALTWDGTDRNHVRVASGLYFLKVQSGNQALSHRLVLFN